MFGKIFTASLILIFSALKPVCTSERKTVPSADKQVTVVGDESGPGGMPERLKVNVGRIKVELAAKTFMNLNGIWLGSREVCNTNKGFYGQVIAFSNGFVGTGHLENKIGETGLSLRFFVNGKETVSDKIPGNMKSFAMEKHSVLKDIAVDYSLSLEGNCLAEKTVWTGVRATKFDIAYNFMHPWTGKVFSDYILCDSGRAKKSGSFSEVKKNKMIEQDNPAWAAFYDRGAGLLVISIAKAEGGVECLWRLWNRDPVDRKLYFAVKKRKMKKDEKFGFEMATYFFRVKPGKWQEVAEEKAKVLQR